MPNEQNAALVRRYFEECLNRAGGPDQQRALAVLDEVLSPDFVMSFNNEPDADARRGQERHKEFVARHARNYTDDRWSVEALVADEGTAACQWHLRATHAETGNPIDVRAADFYTIQEGRLTALRRFLDFHGLNQQRQPKS